MTYPAMPWVVILVVSMIYRVFVLRTKIRATPSPARPPISVAGGRRPKKGYASRMEGYACVCARIRHPCRMGAYAPVWEEALERAPAGQNSPRKTGNQHKFPTMRLLCAPCVCGPRVFATPNEWPKYEWPFLGHGFAGPFYCGRNTTYLLLTIKIPK